MLETLTKRHQERFKEAITEDIREQLKQPGQIDLDLTRCVDRLVEETVADIVRELSN